MRDGLEKARLATAAKRREMENSARPFEMEEDLAAMRVTAPHDGIVYYGMSQRARSDHGVDGRQEARAGGKLMMREVS